MTAVFIAMVKLLEKSLQAPHPPKNTIIFLVEMTIRVSRSWQDLQTLTDIRPEILTLSWQLFGFVIKFELVQMCF